MKIIIYLTNFLTPSMTFVYNQLREIEKQNDVLVLTQNRNNKTLFPYDVSILEFPRNLRFQINRVLRKTNIYYGEKNRIFSQQLNNKINEIRPDLIHVHFGPSLIQIYDNIKNKNIPILVTFHGYDVSSLLRIPSYVKRIKKIFDNNNIYATTVAEDMIKRLNSKGIKTKNIITDYLGVNTSFFKPTESNKEFIFLQVSNFVEKKGHFITLQAFKKFLLKSSENKKYKLVLAGDGPLKDKAKEFAEELGISEFVEFPGYVNREETRRLMNQAFCFVHHSITAKNGDKEGIPTVIMEAMAMSLPILSTYHSGIPELVRHEKDGFLVNENDINDYADKMNKILKFQENSMRNRIVMKFNLDKNSESLIKIYENIVKAKTTNIHANS